jgi:hypothetical protein
MFSSILKRLDGWSVRGDHVAECIIHGFLGMIPCGMEGYRGKVSKTERSKEKTETMKNIKIRHKALVVKSRAI